ncbi:MAG: PP2C family protein-serine/threonine phosphatase, partial [Candidatus Eisenbacteria bacterium]
DPHALLAEACSAVMSSLRLDGVTAVRFGPSVAMAVAHAGARRMPHLGLAFTEAVARRSGPRELAELALTHEDREALEMSGVHWTLVLPGTPPVGALLLGRRKAGAWLDRGEARDLERLADHLGVALENLELKREVRSQHAMHRELADAHQVQVHRLPRRTPIYPTLDCAAAALSTEAVGGDHYDFIEGGPRDFTLAVGDAAGHGVPAALVLAGVQSRFRNEAQRARHPGELLEALNRDLVAMEQPEKFVAMLCARVDAAAGSLRFANAGQIPPIVRRHNGTFEEFNESGLLLGVSPDARYRISNVALGSGDVVVMCTDGLTEASRGGHMFGTEGVRRVLDLMAHRRASDIVEELLAAVRLWADGPLDDVTIVVLKQLTRPGGRVDGPHSGLKSGD